MLTANLINKVSNLEESGTSATSPATRTYIAELRAEFHSRSRERLEKLTSGVNPANLSNQTGIGITIVKVGGGNATSKTTPSGATSGNSPSALNILAGGSSQQRATGSRSELNVYNRLSAAAGPQQITSSQKTSLFLNGGQRPDISGASLVQPSSLLTLGGGSNVVNQRNFEVRMML